MVYIFCQSKEHTRNEDDDNSLLLILIFFFPFFFSVILFLYILSHLSNLPEFFLMWIHFSLLFIFDLSFSNSLLFFSFHCHPSDTPGTNLIPHQLTGSENYSLWSRAMSIFLLAKNKIKFIDGTCSCCKFGRYCRFKAF